MTPERGPEPVEVVVVAYRSPELLLSRCLAPLGGRHRVTVVDNSSSDEVRSVAASYGARYLDPGENLGFAAGVNLALRGRNLDRDVLLLNPDAVIDEAQIARLRVALEVDDRIACVAPAQRAPGSTHLDRVCWPFPSPGRAWLEALGLARLIRSADFAIGSVLLIRSAALVDVGGLDERYFLYAEESDWQLRATRRGWSMFYCHDVIAEHVGAGTGGDPIRRELHFHASQQLFVAKWHGSAGWQAYRAAIVVGAVVRGALLRGEARRSAIRRALLYVKGPARELERTGAGPRRADALGCRADPRLRVLHVVCTDNFAGVERYVVSVATGSAAKGLDVTVVGGDHVRMPDELSGTTVRWYPARSVGTAVVRLWKLGSFDIVHVHMFEAELAAVLSRPRIGHAVVATRHFAQRRGSSAPARLVGRGLTRLIRTQLAISRFVAERVEGDTIIVEPGVPSVASTMLASEREEIVVMVQRLDREKRGEVGIAAFASSGLAGRGWRLVIAGGGGERARLEALAHSAGVAGSCDFLGATSEVQKLYQRAAIFLATRPDEPYGLSVVEAMAAGIPVVAARGGGHLETVGTASDAALFAGNDAAAAGALLARLAADPAGRQRYGDALRQLQQERFTVDRQVDRTIEVYRSMWETVGR